MEGDRGYGQTAQRMFELARDQPGFLGAESVRGQDGFGITVSYWSSEEAIAAWKAHLEHKPAQDAGKRVWYADLELPRSNETTARRRSKAIQSGPVVLAEDDLMTKDYSQDFVRTEGKIWLNCAHQGPLPRVAAAEAQEAIAWKSSLHLLRDELFFEVPLRLRRALGKLIAVPPEEIILGNSASYGSAPPGERCSLARGG